jgi:DtxR family Mn-dependent transcriptional regulator
LEADLSYEAEEYVETIYRLQKRRGVAKTKDLADELKVVPGSITNTIEHLEKHSLVKHEPYRGVRLTQKGEKLALDILRRHRLAERLLADILNAEWSDVHESACKLEHALNKDVIALLEKKLENPRVCPHGNPIPTEKGELEEEESYPVTEIGLNETCIVAKITDERRTTLQALSKRGIRPGIPVHVVKSQPSSIVLCVNGKECTLNHDIASSIWVRPIRREACAIQK